MCSIVTFTQSDKLILTSKHHICITYFVFRHLDFFEMVRNEDEKELARKFELVSKVLN